MQNLSDVLFGGYSSLSAQYSRLTAPFAFGSTRPAGVPWNLEIATSRGLPKGRTTGGAGGASAARAEAAPWRDGGFGGRVAVAGCVCVYLSGGPKKL